MKKSVSVKEYILPGIKLFLNIKSSDYPEDMQASVFTTKGADIAVSIPVKDGAFYPVQKGLAIDIHFFHGSGRFFFNSVVKDRVIYEGVPLLILSMPTTLSRTERRMYYRIDTLFEVKVIIPSEEITPTGKRKVFKEYRARCIDISGGGIMLDPKDSANIPLKFGVEVEIDFCEALPIDRVSAIAVRAAMNKGKGLGLQFTSITDSGRDKIIKYVFNKQLGNKKILEKQP